MRLLYRITKRAVDLLAAVGVLALTSPVGLVIAILIRRADGGPIFYRGERVGRHGNIFRMYKFRSMVVDADKLGGSSSSADDPRLTGIGASIRRHKLDELPQFLNVLSGDMSLVGPRPQVPWAVAQYLPVERRLLSVKPGITDWSSIVFRDEGTILAQFDDADLAYEINIRPEKSRLGICYVDTASLRTDFRILLATIRVLVGGPAPVPPCASTPPVIPRHIDNS